MTTATSITTPTLITPPYDALFHVNKPPTEQIGLAKCRWISFAELVDNANDPMSVNPVRISDIVTPPSHLPGYGPPLEKDTWVFWDIEPTGRHFPRDARVSSEADIKRGLDWILFWINGAREIRPDLKHALLSYGMFCDPTVVGRRDGYGSTAVEQEMWRNKYRRWLFAQQVLWSHELLEWLDAQLIECYYRYPGFESDEESIHKHMLEIARKGSQVVRDRVIAKRKANREPVTAIDETLKPAIACISMQSPNGAAMTPAQMQSALRVAGAADASVLWGNFHEPDPDRPGKMRRCQWNADDPTWRIVRDGIKSVTPPGTVS